MAYLVLWDVDETLIHVGGMHRAIWLDVCSEVSGRRATSLGATPGRTSPQVLLDGLVAAGVGGSDALRALPRAMELEEAHFRNRRTELHAAGHVSPGAESVLHALDGTEGVVQAPLTGNLRTVAMLKLDVFGLARYFNFDVGAYGSDDRVRPNLGPLAERRAHEILGMNPAETTTVLIGDSPLDVATGKRIGARVVAVATGITDGPVLRAAGADVVLPGMGDAAAVVDAILDAADEGARHS